jgi:hypothetical protein
VWLQINVPASSVEELEECLELLTKIAERQVRRHKLPHPYVVAGLGYEREPRPRERWQTPVETLRRGVGDCEDLATFLAGWLRAHGDPRARAFLQESPGVGYHALVRTGSGQVLDPSRKLGMNA